MVDYEFGAYLAKYQYGRYDGKDKYDGVSSGGNKPGCTLKARSEYATREAMKVPKDFSWSDPKRTSGKMRGL